MIETGLKNDLIYSEDEFKNYNASNRNIEMQIIPIDQPHVTKMVLINLYSPPQGNTTEFFDKLYHTIVSLGTILNKDFELFIFRDFNINYISPISPGYKNIKWLEQRLGLHQLIHSPTRYALGNTCIDLIFSNCNCIRESGVIDVNISDHQNVLVTRKNEAKLKIETNFTGRSYLYLCQF